MKTNQNNSKINRLLILNERNGSSELRLTFNYGISRHLEKAKKKISLVIRLVINY